MKNWFKKLAHWFFSLFNRLKEKEEARHVSTGRHVKNTVMLKEEGSLLVEQQATGTVIGEKIEEAE